MAFGVWRLGFRNLVLVLLQYLVSEVSLLDRWEDHT